MSAVVALVAHFLSVAFGKVMVAEFVDQRHFGMTFDADVRYVRNNEGLSL